MYFVITTLTTCGFGDIYATEQDNVEAFVITMLEFIGLLFYSYSIDKMQSIITTKEQSAGEYSSMMVEKFESLIVKVGRVMPEKGEKINHNVLNEWKIYTQEYFQFSPNPFLAENEFFQNLSN